MEILLSIDNYEEKMSSDEKKVIKRKLLKMLL